MATSATAIADVFSPTYATSTAPTVSVSAGSTASGQIDPPAGISYTPTASVYGSSGGSSTGTFACAPCCGGASGGEGFLPAWFGPNGLCPGAVDNSVPVTVWANFLTQFIGGVPGSSYCMKTAFSLQMIANDYSNPDKLVFVDPPNACPITPPVLPRPTYGQAIMGSIWVGKNWVFPSKTMTKDRIQPVNLVFCTCSNDGQLAFVAEASSYSNQNNYQSIQADSAVGSCLPFSQAFGEPVPNFAYALSYSYPGRIIRRYGSTPIGNWMVTFTL